MKSLTLFLLLSLNSFAQAEHINFLSTSSAFTCALENCEFSNTEEKAFTINIDTNGFGKFEFEKENLGQLTVAREISIRAWGTTKCAIHIDHTYSNGKDLETFSHFITCEEFYRSGYTDMASRVNFPNEKTTLGYVQSLYMN